MRTQTFRVFFLKSNDDAIQRKAPGSMTLVLKSNRLKISTCTVVPLQRLGEVSTAYEVHNKEISAGKALVGTVIAGPLGTVIGGAMGGRRTVATLTLRYIGADGLSKETLFETSSAESIKAQIDKYCNVERLEPTTNMQTAVQPQIKRPSSTFKRLAYIYFFWPFMALKKLQNSLK